MTAALPTAFLSGFTLGLGLITAIGAQNAFVLRQGLRDEHLFAVCACCALSDAVLILAGVRAFDIAAAYLPLLAAWMAGGGAVYLFGYGLRVLHRAWRGGDALTPGGDGGRSLLSVLATCLALTWLNPHVYLDTVLLIGSLSVAYGEGKYLFAGGAMTASLLFFFTLGYLSRLLSPLLARPWVWRGIEFAIGAVMLLLAGKLALMIRL